MTSVNQLTPGNLGAEFDVAGSIEPNKVRIRLGAGLTNAPDGSLTTQIAQTTSLSPLVYNGSAYVGAQADAEENVADLLQLASGDVVHSEFVEWTGHGLTVGQWYFLDQAASGFTANEPTSGIVQRLFYVVDANVILVSVQEAYSVNVSTSAVSIVQEQFVAPGDFPNAVVTFSQLVNIGAFTIVNQTTGAVETFPASINGNQLTLSPAVTPSDSLSVRGVGVAI